MKPEEQAEFVRNYCNIVRDGVLALIQHGRVPAEFDGHELRVLLSDNFKERARLSDLRKHPHGQRNKNYHNWVATTPGG